jgi:hypothetical protein
MKELGNIEVRFDADAQTNASVEFGNGDKVCSNDNPTGTIMIYRVHWYILMRILYVETKRKPFIRSNILHVATLN